MRDCNRPIYMNNAATSWPKAPGVAEAVAEKGWLGLFTGGTMATAGGIAAAIFFGLLVALIFKPKSK